MVIRTLILVPITVSHIIYTDNISTLTGEVKPKKEVAVEKGRRQLKLDEGLGFMIWRATILKAKR